MGKKQLDRNVAMYKSIPYLCCFEEGEMIETEPGVYSRSYQNFTVFVFFCSYSLKMCIVHIYIIRKRNI